MPKEIILYHGSEKFIRTPEYGKGKPYNDYGPGFYCTESIALAKEWACDDSHGGFANKYRLNTEGLRTLDLNGPDFCIIHWISVLLKNRQFTLDSEMAVQAREYILKNFPVVTEGYDIVRGYRADDSYFSYAKDFLQNTISVRRLSEAMKLGNLGIQIVLVSPKAFQKIRFIGFEEAPKEIHLPLRKKRDELARIAYLSDKTGSKISKDDVFILDIMRNEMKSDDPRLQ